MQSTMMHKTTKASPSNGLLVTSEMRLGLRQWAIVLAIVALVASRDARLWKHVERFDTGADYRIPYQLSNDYWLFDWRLQKTADAKPIVVLGDSVVWGEYVKSDGTLPHFLSQQAGQPDRFVNAGVNGLFPLALEGLVRDYGTSLHDRKVIVVCNLLWLSSPESRHADRKRRRTSTMRRSCPSSSLAFPAYQADANERLSAVIGRQRRLPGLGRSFAGRLFPAAEHLAVDVGRRPQPAAALSQRLQGSAGPNHAGGSLGPRRRRRARRGKPRHKPWTAGGARQDRVRVGGTGNRRCNGPRFSGLSTCSATAATTCW